MADPFVIRGDQGAALTLLEGERGSHWIARLTLPEVEAETRFYERFSGTKLDLGSYFGRLADEWRGWNGQIDFEADVLSLSAEHDGSGNVTLAVKLSRWGDPQETWAVSGSVVVEAGALDQLARDARRFDDATGTEERWYGWPPPSPKPQ